MYKVFNKIKSSGVHRFISFMLAAAFITIPPVPLNASAQTGAPALNTFTAPLTSVAASPVIINGMTVHPHNPLKFDFIVNTGDLDPEAADTRTEIDKLIKYFLAALTVPEDQLWVNLSPYEENKIIADGLSLTAMGRDLLAQDYALKQMSASLVNPDTESGEAFWNQVHRKAEAVYGSSDVPVSTFNKIWIVPEKAVVYQNNTTAYVIESHLKVMLEEDYVALRANSTEATSENVSDVSSEVFKQTILPLIEEEVNTGETFANLRQIVNTMILSTWYKNNLRESILGQTYVDRNRTSGIELEEKNAKEKIYNEYIDLFRTGVFDIVKEEYNPETNEIIPRKYFSGGFDHQAGAVVTVRDQAQDMAMLADNEGNTVTVGTELKVLGPEGIEGAIAELTARTVTPTGTANLAKKLGIIPHNESEADGYFSVNRAIRQAGDAGRIRDIDESYVRDLRTFIEDEKVVATLDRAGVNKDDLLALLDDPDVKIKLVGDMKNESPFLVMRNANNYQASHESFRNKTIYHGEGMIEALKEKNDEGVQVLLLRGLVALATGISTYDVTKDNYEEAVKTAESRAEAVEKALRGERFDEILQEVADEFLDSYYQVLADKNIVWDYEISLFDEERGKELVGGKSYQQAKYWSDDPSRNFRSFAGSTKASERFLKSDPQALQRIYEILDELDTSDEAAREDAYSEIRQIVLSIDVPRDIADELERAATKLAQEINVPVAELLLAIRSAGKAEDISLDVPELRGITLGANAGQHDSYLGELIGDLVRRWRDDVASLYTDRVLDYRDGMMVYSIFGEILPDKRLTQNIIDTLSASSDSNDQLVAKAFNDRDIKIISTAKIRKAFQNNGFDEQVEVVNRAKKQFIEIENISMGVTIMPMADVEISFVAFGHDLTSGWTAKDFQNIPEGEYLNKGRVVTISTTYGIGEAIVQGVATPDVYLVHIFEDENGEHINILGRQLGTKTVQAIYTKPILEQLGLDQDAVSKLAQDIETEAESGQTAFGSNMQPLIRQKVDETQQALNDLSDSDMTSLLSELAERGFNIDKNNFKLFVQLLKANQEDPGVKTMFTDVAEDKRKEFSATDSQVISIAREYMSKARNYGSLVDMEGAVGNNLGRPNTAVTVQRRPSNVEGDVDEARRINIEYTYVNNKDLKQALSEEEVVDEPTGLIKGETLIQGIATRNAFSGEIYNMMDDSKTFAEHEREIKRIADTGRKIIIRARETTPDFMPILKYNNVMGVIADVGGATSHAAVVSRELGIATVVGIKSFVDKIKQDQGSEAVERFLSYLNTNENIVTVDANANESTGYGTVYAGELPASTRVIDVDISRLPEVYTKFGYIMGMPHPMLQMSKISQYEGYYGVALMRGEFAYAEENINPRFGRAYDNMIVYHYLNVRNAEDRGEAYRQTLSAEERAALEKFESALAERNEKRKAGKDVPMDQTETILERFANLKADQFLKALDVYAQRDIATIRQSGLEEIRKLTGQITGYVSYDEFFDAVHGAAVATMAAANSQQDGTVVYRSIDFKKNEARDLIGSTVFDPTPESSTMIGERGARWLLQPENEIILREEIRVLLRQVAKGYTNIGFMFPFVSTPEELDRLLEILVEEERNMTTQLTAEVGKPTLVYLREVGQMIELPSNVIQADEFIAVLKKHELAQKEWFRSEYSKGIKRGSFFSFGTNDLTQLTLGADRDNPAMSWLFNEAHPYVIESIRHVANAAKEAGVKCGLCGQAIVNLINVDPESAMEIIMMLGDTGGYAATDYLGTLALAALDARATLLSGRLKNRPSIESELADFSSSLRKGAESRPAFFISRREDFEKAYVGDYVVLDEYMDVGEMDFTEDPELMTKIKQLGAVVLYSDLQKPLIKTIEDLGVPVVVLNTARGFDRVTGFIGEAESIDDAKIMTIDFNNNRIYKGKQDVEVIVPFTGSKISIADAQPEITPMQADRVFTANEFYTSSVGHPGEISIDTDADKEDFIEAFKIAFRRAAGTQDGTVIYETMDLQSDDLNTLTENEDLENEEVNPALGLYGLDALVNNPSLTPLFELEMQAVSELIAEGYDIAIQLNSARVPDSVGKALKVIEAAGISNDVEVGFDTSWPGNYLFTDQFLKRRLSFVTLDHRKLAQAYLAADMQKNPNMTRWFDTDELVSNLNRPIAMIKAEANRMGAKVKEVGFTDTAPQVEADNAQLGDTTPGGIDLNPEWFELEVEYGVNGKPLPVYRQPVHNLKIDGLIPVINTITPVNLTPLLGFKSAVEPDQVSLAR